MAEESTGSSPPTAETGEEKAEQSSLIEESEGKDLPSPITATDTSVSVAEPNDGGGMTRGRDITEVDEAEAKAEEENRVRNEIALKELELRLVDPGAFRLVAPNRVILLEGVLLKKGTEKAFKRSNERFCVLCSDGLLLTHPSLTCFSIGVDSRRASQILLNQATFEE